jgi:splicing factor 3B subunit 3
LYQINSIGEEEEELISCDSTMNININVRFNPRKLKNIEIIDEIQSLCCVTDLHVEDLVNEGTPQIYSLCGRGSRSTLRVLRPGLTITEIANSNLPGAIALWTLKGNINDKYHKYAVVSFHNSTKVLAIGEKG